LSQYKPRSFRAFVHEALGDEDLAPLCFRGDARRGVHGRAVEVAAFLDHRTAVGAHAHA
jgi:hypothetical protein